MHWPKNVQTHKVFGHDKPQYSKKIHNFVIFMRAHGRNLGGLSRREVLSAWCRGGVAEGSRCPRQPVNSPGQVQGSSEAGPVEALALVAAVRMHLSRGRLLKAVQHCRPPTEGVTHNHRDMQRLDGGGRVRACSVACYSRVKETTVLPPVETSDLSASS